MILVVSQLCPASGRDLDHEVPAPHCGLRKVERGRNNTAVLRGILVCLVHPVKLWGGIWEQKGDLNPCAHWSVSWRLEKTVVISARTASKALTETDVVEFEPLRKLESLAFRVVCIGCAVKVLGVINPVNRI